MWLDDSVNTARGALYVPASGIVEREPADSLAGRSEIVDVVGGARVADDGDYFVRISGSTAGDIQAAVRKLEALPQVYYAGPLFVGRRGAVRP